MTDEGKKEVTIWGLTYDEHQGFANVVLKTAIIILEGEIKDNKPIEPNNLEHYLETYKSVVSDKQIEYIDQEKDAIKALLRPFSGSQGKEIFKHEAKVREYLRSSFKTREEHGRVFGTEKYGDLAAAHARMDIPAAHKFFHKHHIEQDFEAAVNHVYPNKFKVPKDEYRPVSQRVSDPPSNQNSFFTRPTILKGAAGVSGLGSVAIPLSIFLNELLREDPSIDHLVDFLQSGTGKGLITAEAILVVMFIASLVTLAKNNKGTESQPETEYNSKSTPLPP